MLWGGRSRKAAGRKRREIAKEQDSCPKEYKQWTDKSMQGALKAVSEGMGVNRAASVVESQGDPLTLHTKKSRS